MSEEERQAIIHLLDKQARYEYCIKNNISFSDEDYEAYIIRQSMINKDKEIERLNNIINQLEKELKDDYKIWMCNSRSNGKSVKFGIDVCKMHFYNRLQELKGSDKEC